MEEGAQAVLDLVWSLDTRMHGETVRAAEKSAVEEIKQEHVACVIAQLMGLAIGGLALEVGCRCQEMKAGQSLVAGLQAKHRACRIDRSQVIW